MDGQYISSSFEVHHNIMDEAMKKIKKNLGVAQKLGSEFSEMRKDCVKKNMVQLLPEMEQRLGV